MSSKWEKIEFVTILIVLGLLIPFYFGVGDDFFSVLPDASVTRSFDNLNPSVGDIVTVTLTPSGGEGRWAGIVRENIPLGVEVKSVENTEDNQIKKLLWSVDTESYTYTFTSHTGGTFTFEGTYVFADSGPSGSIGGVSEIVFSAVDDAPECEDDVDCDDNNDLTSEVCVNEICKYTVITPSSSSGSGGGGGGGSRNPIITTNNTAVECSADIDCVIRPGFNHLCVNNICEYTEEKDNKSIINVVLGLLGLWLIIKIVRDKIKKKK